MQELLSCYTTDEDRRTGKLALPHFVVELFFSVFPAVILRLYSHGARLSPLFPVWKSI